MHIIIIKYIFVFQFCSTAHKNVFSPNHFAESPKRRISTIITAVSGYRVSTPAAVQPLTEVKIFPTSIVRNCIPTPVLSFYSFSLRENRPSRVNVRMSPKRNDSVDSIFNLFLLVNRRNFELTMQF